jgi:signal transduction histidine kinase
MGTLPWSLALCCMAVAALAAWLDGRCRAMRAMRVAQAALCTQEATMRLLRLSAGDQRNVALTMFGQAQTSTPADPALTALARRLLDMSEDLTQQTETPSAVRTLAAEDMQLMPVLEFAMAQVAAHLGPSRRAWRIDPSFERTRLLADRRALNQVLVNVLSGAAASTRDGDWIELSAEPGEDDWSIVVQDEGIGLPVAQLDTRPEESRGIGLRLTLARSLMQAHGGKLTVESAERVGTRVRLSLPRFRLLS